MENDEGLGVRTRVSAIEPRETREKWAESHVATMANTEARRPGTAGTRK